MKYNGIELVPITKVQAFEEPKRMLVWSECIDNITTKMVCAIIKRKHDIRVVCDDYNIYHFCAEIPQPQTREMTSLEVMEFLHNEQIKFDEIKKGVIVYNPDEDIKMWSSYTQLDTYDNIQSCKFGVLKNGKVTEFELPQIEVNNQE